LSICRDFLKTPRTGLTLDHTPATQAVNLLSVNRAIFAFSRS
jgi:hypothetical protein